MNFTTPVCSFRVGIPPHCFGFQYGWTYRSAMNGHRRVVHADCGWSVLVQNFTFNCGIRALSKISIVYQQFASLWLLTIESWLYYIGYTYAVASDGSSSGIINNLLMNHGIDWHREVLDRNRNSYPGTSLWLYWKKLDPTQLEINWLDALQKANP